MRTFLLLTSIIAAITVSAQKIPGTLLHRNGMDSTANTLLFSVYSAGCKNCLYLNEDLLRVAAKSGYKTHFIISGLAEEDLEAFKETEPFISKYHTFVDRELNNYTTIVKGDNTICLLEGTRIQSKVSCDDAGIIYKLLRNEKVDYANKDYRDSVQVDTSYKFNAGSAAYLNTSHCLVMDTRFNRKMHKININTGEIVQQFKMDEKQWAEKIYNSIYNGNNELVSKSVKARDLYLKKGRIFGEQEFEPENITVKNNRIILSMRFNFPFIDEYDDTLRKMTKVIFELSEDFTIKEYWVASIEFLPEDFFITVNTNMTSLYSEGDNILLPVTYRYTPRLPSKKYNYAKFLLDKNHKITFQSYLPFLVPDDKAEITGDYNVLHMYLVDNGNQLIGSYITWPAIYNVTSNTKITDIDLMGLPSHKVKTKIDSLIFEKTINNLGFVILYFEKYGDRYIMQSKNQGWNIYSLYDKNFKPLKHIYASKDKEEGNIFHIKNDVIYSIKFGVKDESDVYIYRQNVNNLFEIDQ